MRMAGKKRNEETKSRIFGASPLACGESPSPSLWEVANGLCNWKVMRELMKQPSLPLSP